MLLTVCFVCETLVQVVLPRSETTNVADALDPSGTGTINYMSFLGPLGIALASATDVAPTGHDVCLKVATVFHGWHQARRQTLEVAEFVRGLCRCLRYP
jgi:hypothetical protein